MKTPTPHKIEGFWHLVRRVPKAFAEFDPRVIVRITTGIRVADDPRAVRARPQVGRLNANLETFWVDLRDGNSADAQARYDAARLRARARGFEYVPVATLAASGTTDQLLERLESLFLNGRENDEREVEAVLGGVSLPALRLSELLDVYESSMRASMGAKSPAQIVKWENPKRAAIFNLMQVVGDKAITELTRADALDFKSMWQDRIVAGEIEIVTANKDIGHLSKMFRVVNDDRRLGMTPVFAALKIEGGEEGHRPAFLPDFVQTEILCEGVLADLNPEARRVIYLMAETGLRITEAVNLTQDTIRLRDAIPHVQVRPDGREMKTAQSRRDVPLVGVALASMKLQPDGFPRYREKASSLSALVNKYLANHRLRPTPQHTLYSLRHTFEDRLTAVEAPEKLTAALMGHKFSRPKYGAGPSLAQKREWLERIAFRAPVAL